MEDDAYVKRNMGSRCQNMIAFILFPPYGL